MFERFDPNTEEQEDRFFEAAEPNPEASWLESRVHHEEDEIDELPVMLRGLARMVKLMGQSIKRWVNREHWEVGYQSIKEMIQRGEEGLVIALAPKWVGSHG